MLFLERVSPAIEQVDGSSGAIGTAVNHAVEDLSAIIAEAPADADTRAAWLAYSATMKAAGTIGRAAETKDRIRRLAGGGPGCGFVAQVLGRELGIGP